VDFVDRTDSVQLYSADLTTPQAKPTAASIGDASQLFGPASSERATLVGKPATDGRLRLVVVAR
jgi:hypothetical protein